MDQLTTFLSVIVISRIFIVLSSDFYFTGEYTQSLIGISYSKAERRQGSNGSMPTCSHSYWPNDRLAN